MQIYLNLIMHFSFAYKIPTWRAIMFDLKPYGKSDKIILIHCDLNKNIA